MSWYVVSTVILVEFEDGVQDVWPAWENVLLIEAVDEQEAAAKAEHRAREEENSQDQSMTWNGRPVRHRFIALRSLMLCAFTGERPGDGTELYYEELRFRSREDLRRFCEIKEVEVIASGDDD